MMFDCGGGTTLLIYETKARRGENTQAGFWVDNLEAEMADLRSRGVVFEEYDFPGLKTVIGIKFLQKNTEPGAEVPRF